MQAWRWRQRFESVDIDVSDLGAPAAEPERDTKERWVADGRGAVIRRRVRRRDTYIEDDEVITSRYFIVPELAVARRRRS
jgi:hypothetical protein